MKYATESTTEDDYTESSARAMREETRAVARLLVQRWFEPRAVRFERAAAAVDRVIGDDLDDARFAELVDLCLA